MATRSVTGWTGAAAALVLVISGCSSDGGSEAGDPTTTTGPVATSAPETTTTTVAPLTEADLEAALLDATSLDRSVGPPEAMERRDNPDSVCGTGNFSMRATDATAYAGVGFVATDPAPETAEYFIEEIYGFESEADARAAVDAQRRDVAGCESYDDDRTFDGIATVAELSLLEEGALGADVAMLLTWTAVEDGPGADAAGYSLVTYTVAGRTVVIVTYQIFGEDLTRPTYVEPANMAELVAVATERAADL